MDSVLQPRFRRVGGARRPPVPLRIDGRPVEAQAGDTVLTALMLHGGAVRRWEFGAELRAGFCAMGACQDCWVSLADGRRVRACTTFVEPGMEIVTGLDGDA